MDLALIAASTETILNDSEIDLDSVFSDDYRLYLLFADAIKPATDQVQLQFRVKVGGTLQSAAGDYSYDASAIQGGAWSLINSDSVSLIFNESDIGNQTGEFLYGVYYIYRPNDSENGFFSLWGEQFSVNNTGSGDLGVLAGQHDTEGANVDGLRLYLSSGNFAAGARARLYGVKGS